MRSQYKIGQYNSPNVLRNPCTTFLLKSYNHALFICFPMNILEYCACSKNSNYVARVFWITNDDVPLLKIVHYNTNLLECSSPHHQSMCLKSIHLFYSISKEMMSLPVSLQLRFHIQYSS